MLRVPPPSPIGRILPRRATAVVEQALADTRVVLVKLDDPFKVMACTTSTTDRAPAQHTSVSHSSQLMVIEPSSWGAGGSTPAVLLVEEDGQEGEIGFR
jgi:hypothetical protein